jgi:ribonuclease ZC3H12
LIILDASNIAMRHGNQKFSSKGIEIVINYFQSNGHKVVSFLPEYFFRQKDPNSYLNKKRVVPDNIDYLKELNDKHLVIQSPPQDYDDSYCIQYAKTHDAFIITNDLFRDYLDNINDNRKRETERMWIKERCISFTFNQDEFIPNPDASFFKEFDVNEYNKFNKEINFKNS